MDELLSRNLPGAVDLIQVDVSEEKSIEAAAEEVRSKYGRQVSVAPSPSTLCQVAHAIIISRLDALVNNAAIGTPEGTLAQKMNDCFRTNSTGPAVMAEAFAPLLEKSVTTPRILNVTSGAGSIELRLDPSGMMYKQQVLNYRASKSALNMITACQSVEYGPKGWKVFCFCPGFTVSNLSNMNKAENGAKPTSEGARPMVDILNGKRR